MFFSKKIIILMLSVLLCFTVHAESTTSSTKNKVLKSIKKKLAPSYLFVGNSLTANNYGVHNHLKAMFNEVGYTPKISVELYGGSSFKKDYERDSTLAEIKNGNHAVVILQGNSHGPLRGMKKNFLKYGGFLGDAVKKTGNTPVYFQTWHHRDSIKEARQIKQQYGQLALSQKVSVVPVGDAFIYILKKYPEVDLYSDNTHSNEAGTFLAAAVFYTFFTHKSAEKLAYDGGLEKHTAKKLKTASTAVVLRAKK